MKAALIRWLLSRRFVQTWLLAAGKAKASADEVIWTNDDAKALEGFLCTGTGQKLALLLENTKADADANAILRATPATAYGLVCVARGVRVAVARMHELTAVRQPTDTENTAASLPPELEHLSDT